jgi:hypothetical protein
MKILYWKDASKEFNPDVRIWKSKIKWKESIPSKFLNFKNNKIHKILVIQNLRFYFKKLRPCKSRLMIWNNLKRMLMISKTDIEVKSKKCKNNWRKAKGNKKNKRVSSISIDNSSKKRDQVWSHKWRNLRKIIKNWLNIRINLIVKSKN